MGFPGGFTFRQPRIEDGPAVAEMLNQEAQALIGVAVVGFDWVVTPWTAPGADLERDFAVVVSPDGELGGT